MIGDRQFSHYAVEIIAGPAHDTVLVDCTYYDWHGEVLGKYGETMISFACTWRDVATVLRSGLAKIGYDADPVKHVSPMVDLT